MGILRPISSATVYSQDFHWARSPEVWKSFIKAFLIGVVTGMILWASVMSGEKSSATNSNPKVTVTVTQTVLPNIKR